MIEPEMAFFELTDNMDLAEAFLKRICRDVLERCAEDMQFFQERIDPTVMTTLEGIVTNEFVRLPYTEAVDILSKSGETFEFPAAWGADLQAEHERYLTEKHFQKPVILYDYPRGDQGVLHAAQRRRQDGAGDGRAGAARRRDHRRQPARGTARRAGSADEGARPRTRQRTGGIWTCGATARCRTPASAWAWSGRCSSSPAWPTSAT